MKITETKSERHFTLELSELELQSIVTAIGITNQQKREERSTITGVKILDSICFFNLFSELRTTLEGNQK